MAKKGDGVSVIVCAGDALTMVKTVTGLPVFGFLEYYLGGNIPQLMFP